MSAQPGDLRVNRANLLRRVGRACFDVGGTPALPAPAQAIFGPGWAPLTLIFDHAHEAGDWADRWDLYRKEWTDSGVRFVEATGLALADADGNGGVELTVHGYSAVDVSAPADTDPDDLSEASRRCPISVPHGPHNTPGVAPCGGVDDPADPDPRIAALADRDGFPGGAPLVHLLKDVGAACGLPLRLTDSCATDSNTVTCAFCLDLPTVEDAPPRGIEDGNGEAKPTHVEGHGHQRGGAWHDEPSGEHPVLKPRYDPTPTILLAPGQTYTQWYEAYADQLDREHPGWWNDPTDGMAGELIGLAEVRRQEVWAQTELDQDRIPTAEGFEASQGGAA